MDTTSVNLATARSAASVAGARDSTRDFLERLVRPLPAETADTVVLVVPDGLQDDVAGRVSRRTVVSR
ncbi:hypothetical protein [Streptomyces sp. NPDC048349]|uniref:hypothetical protein n=1 Tax=Streptomyces sp. NPDC048349 TaxID=3155486 RepID=UPI00341D30B8